MIECNHYRLAGVDGGYKLLSIRADIVCRLDKLYTAITGTTPGIVEHSTGLSKNRIWVIIERCPGQTRGRDQFGCKWAVGECGYAYRSEPCH